MTPQLQILLALKGLIQKALPQADVRGFDGDSSVPEIIPAGGVVIGHFGDPGDPDVTLNPPTYSYRHRIPLEIAAPGGVGGLTLDAMLPPIGAIIAANPFLGGLCEYLSVEQASREDETRDEISINWADVNVFAHYSTTNPLG
ncbi:hypothetical protein CA234_03085 [Sphingomonas sp. ABOLE]|uniref:hypothetical protein n=1 Tax=Sphingomonas sp. ABOLE TaxID=1985878 RepID=UPI000F7DD5F3|nr:hypothetical protein [Sphingomonas sp. ABOLE]RSV44414.1 hypothetical protein CA234_03085 [Sphingomonas sp. ABOLE]